MRRPAVISFLALEAGIYAVFLTMDLCNDPALPDIPLKYAGILLCLAFSLAGAARGGDRRVPAALVLTALADALLLVLDRYYALGVALFLGVQMIYLLRLRAAARGSWWPVRIGLVLAAWAGLYALGQATPLNLLAALYFPQLLVNAALAWTKPGAAWRCFALGLTLFVGCDLCVGIRNVPALFPAALSEFARVGMWLFYLPSQVLIALSALPGKEVSP